MIFINSWKTTLYVNTPGYSYMRQSLVVIYSLKNNITPETLPHIGIKLLDMVVFPDGGNKIEFLVFYLIQIFSTKYMMIL